MIKFLSGKIWRNKWLMLCLIVGNILLIGTAIGIPLYISATMQRVFQQDMRAIQYTENRFPAVMTLSYSFDDAPEQEAYEFFRRTNDVLWPSVLSRLDVPIQHRITVYEFASWNFTPDLPREYPHRYRSVRMSAISGFADNITLTHGRLPSDELVDGTVIEALAMNVTLVDRDMLLGELMNVEYVEGGEPLQLRIVGIYELPPETGAFWSLVPINFRNTVLISDRLAYERFARYYSPHYQMQVKWSEVLDFTEINILRQAHYSESLEWARALFDPTYTWTFSENFYEVILGQGPRTDRLAITLWILFLPVFVMLALFIYMVSRQILALDQNVISILESRGAGRAQILLLYVLQGIFVAAIAFPIGLYLGIGVCRFIGASNGFLELVQRETLQVFITAEAILIGCGAALFSFLTMFLPVIRFSKIGIVQHKTTNIGKPKKPVWQRFYVDILLLGFSLYSLFNIGNQQDLIAAAFLRDERGLDPVLFLTSSMFIVSAALVCIRIFPLLVKFVFWLGKSFWPPSIYASMLKVIRSAGEEQFIMLFLIFTVSIGIFSAQAARTINLNNENRIQYLGGADLRFMEQWQDNVPLGGVVRGEFVGFPQVLVYSGPSSARLPSFEEVDSKTRVTIREGTVRIGMRDLPPTVPIMAIETDTFGETVWFRDDLLSIHLNYFLNTLGRNPNGVLLSESFRTEYGLQVGNTIRIEEITPDFMPYGEFVDFTVMGFVERFPGFAPVGRTVIPETELIVEYQRPLAVVNLGYLQRHWGMRPYEVWMRTNTPTNQFIYDFAYEEGLYFSAFHDTKNELVAARLDPIIQGTNGALTISFIIILLICFSGFLIYWMLSIRSRVLQFGIFRAMGMGTRNILTLLLNEQVFVTLTALLIGVIVGEVSSTLFIPLIKISYTPAEQVLPLLMVMELSDYVSLYSVLGVMVVVSMIILGVYISKIKIDQALKLGED